MPNQVQKYNYPQQIVETNTVVDVYVEFPDVEALYEEVGKPSEPTVQEVVNNYNIDNSVEINIYPNGEKAPSTGVSVFQKIFNLGESFVGTAEELAQLYAAAKAISNVSGALINGAGPIYTTATALIGETGAYTLGSILSVAPEAAVAAAAAVAGYKIGNAVFDAIEDYPWFQDMLETASEWIATDEGILAGIYRGILGIQYQDKTYLDSRFYNAIKAKLLSYIPSYDTELYLSNFDWINDVITDKGNIGIYGSTNSAIRDYRLFFSQRNDGSFTPIFTSYVLLRAVGVCVVPITQSDIYGGYTLQIGVLLVASDSPKQISVGTSTTTPPTNTTYTANLDKKFSFGGKTVYYAVVTGSYSASVPPNKFLSDIIPASQVTIEAASSAIFDERYGQLAFSIVYGNIVQAQLPDGLESWTGDTVPDPSVNQIHVVVDTNTSTTVPYYPIALPNTTPSTVNNYYIIDPTTQPDPTQVYNPEEQIYPYTVPSPILPQTDPESDPEENPSESSTVIVPIIIPLPSSGKDDGESPTIQIPTIAPPFDVTGAGEGLFNVYNPTAQELYDFCDWLWVKWTDANLNKIINNPFDGVISLHELYATPATTTAQAITSGFLKSDVNAALVNQRYTTLDCGTIAIPEYFRNYFDYSPYTKAHVFLPFIGIVELNADDISGHAVNITYHIDSYSGACVAIITVARNDGEGHEYSVPQYQFNGNCAVPLPISGGSQANLTAGLWMAGSSAIGSIVNGIIGAVNHPTHIPSNIWNGVSGAISDVASTLLTRKSEVQHSGNMVGNFGAMTGKKPYIIMKRPRQVVAVNYNSDYGYPAHRRVTIGSLSGYTRVREVNVISATATNDEKAKIEALLKQGVYVS